MNTFPSSPQPDSAAAVDPAEAATPPLEPLRPRWSWLVLFLVLCLGVAGFTRITTRPDVIPEAGVVMELPTEVLGMRGEEIPVSEAELAILPDDTEFAKMNYTDGRGNSVICQIVLSGGDRRSIHRPEACLPGQGWNMLTNEPMEIDLGGGRELTVQKLRLSREVETAPGVRRTLPMLFLYWYVGNNMTTHDQINRVLRSNFDLLLHNRVHRWAYVIVSAPVLDGFISGGMNEAQTLDVLRDFIREAVPRFQKSEMPGSRLGPEGELL
jgi:EpsI family protein